MDVTAGKIVDSPFMFSARLRRTGGRAEEN